MRGSVYIILVNWNGWRDTIECLESVMRNSYSAFRVIVCDNGSVDGSLERIKAWAEGRLDILPCPGSLREYSFPPVPKPLPYVEYGRGEAEAGGGAADDGKARLVLIGTGGNLGFAGGNNVGLRYALAKGDFDYVWLLNNDTVIHQDALSTMVAGMNKNPAAGICGSTLLHYERPERVQAQGGGYYCKWIGLPWHIGRFRHPMRLLAGRRVEKLMNYVVGASMVVSRKFLEDVGLMCEEYFLYFEETDWAIRAEGKYRLMYEPESIVFHKVGSSIGTSSNPGRKSMLCDYFSTRNRIYFTRKFYPYALPAIYLMLLGALLTRLLLGRWDRARMIMRLMVDHRTGYEQVSGKP
ncbi:glycosyl transferase family 2 [Geobacter hydrogenophilus]|uniref:Glycosyl transferase family 2 n=1 Tax=Geobacter hydrogenophilus TaxID=40983 RepID=A0A9W6FXA5_9BACT|nr:glycosyltransferase family 2 protein [Geobacter hydrogenophilus]GLI36606.1 glycosyl transferase family 2 [Geobacter hydrogenophilus]